MKMQGLTTRRTLLMMLLVQPAVAMPVHTATQEWPADGVLPSALATDDACEGVEADSCAGAFVQLRGQRIAAGMDAADVTTQQNLEVTDMDFDTYAKAARMQFNSQAFEKDLALTSDGGEKISADFLNARGDDYSAEHKITAEQVWTAVRLYHGRGQDVPVTESVWVDATWRVVQDGAKSSGMDFATYSKAAQRQFASPAFQKELALTDEGGKNICAAFLKAYHPFHDETSKHKPLDAEGLWIAVQMYHGQGKRVPVTENQWVEATWALVKESSSVKS